MKNIGDVEFNPRTGSYQVAVDGETVQLSKSFFFSMIKLDYLESGFSLEETDEIVSSL